MSVNGDPAEIPRLAQLAPRLGVGGALVAIVGAGGVRYGPLPTYPGFLLFAAGIGVGALGGLGLGLAALWQMRQTRPESGRPGRSQAVLGAGVGALLAASGLALVLPAAGAPAIHDITTDLDDPPRFREALSLPANEGRDLSYPHGGAGVPEKQRRAYPDLAPIALDVPPDAAFAAARAAVRDLGWPVVWANARLGIIETHETRGFFGFTDDVVIRVREAPGGSVVDVRSTSRVGVSDLGANARRIRGFAARLREKAGSS